MLRWRAFGIDPADGLAVRPAVDHRKAAMGRVPKHHHRGLRQVEFHHRPGNGQGPHLRLGFGDDRRGGRSVAGRDRRGPSRQLGLFRGVVVLSSGARSDRCRRRRSAPPLCGWWLVRRQPGFVAADARLDLGLRHGEGRVGVARLAAGDQLLAGGQAPTTLTSTATLALAPSRLTTTSALPPRPKYLPMAPVSASVMRVRRASPRRPSCLPETWTFMLAGRQGGHLEPLRVHSHSRGLQSGGRPYDVPCPDGYQDATTHACWNAPASPRFRAGLFN